MKETLMDFVNESFEQQCGEHIFKDGKLNYYALPKVGDFLAKQFKGIEVRKRKELKEGETRIEINKDTIVIEKHEKECIEFAIKCMVNEFEIVGSSLNEIQIGQHNDRVAKIISANRKYSSAYVTCDRKIKRDTALQAELLAVDGLVQLEGEIKSDIGIINKIPTTFKEKIFGAKMTVANLDSMMERLREAIKFYQEAIILISRIDNEINEIGRLKVHVNGCINFLDSVFTDEINKRLDGLEIGDNDFWKKKIEEVKNQLIQLKTRMNQDTIIYLLE